MRKLILITLAVPLVFWLLFLALTRLYSPDTIPGDADFSEADLVLTGADGAPLAATQVVIAEQSQQLGTLLFVAERNLDRNWNSRSFRFRSGGRLARILGGAGFGSLRYDHRGSGASQASARTHQDLDLMLADLRGAARVAFQDTISGSNADGGARFLLAHDSGCAMSLAALERDLDPGLRPRALVLLACDLGDSMLDQWGRKLLHNMQRKSVSPEVLAQARLEWQSIRRTGRLPESFEEIAPEREPPPDLLAFRQTVNYMYSPEMERFRLIAEQIRPYEIIRRLDIPILHLGMEFDAELPPVAAQSAAAFARAMPADLYTYEIVPASNHFLREQPEAVPEAMLIVERLHPWRAISPALISRVQGFLARHSARNY